MAASMGESRLSQKRLNEIMSFAERWAICNGLGATLTSAEKKTTEIATVPFTLFPSVVPRKMLDLAEWTTPHFNRLMHRVALDHEFLEEAFKKVIEVDEFTRMLWKIYCTVREDGIKQPIMLGLHRNDFMMDCSNQDENGQLVNWGYNDLKKDTGALQLKQIEFNTTAAGCQGVGQKTIELHRLTMRMAGIEFHSDEVTKHNPLSEFATGLVKSWELYGNTEAVIIFLVCKHGKCVLDESALEFEIYAINPRIRVLRKTFLDVYDTGHLDRNANLTVDGDEVAIVYLRHGLTPAHYPSDNEWTARLQIELSRAIKCPCVQYQLAGAKKIQQELTRPGALERYIDDPHVVDALRATFAAQYSLDLGPEGDEAMRLALQNPHKYVLKPQLEGGGNNLYGQDIVEFFTKHANSSERNAFILMEKIRPLQQQNYVYKKDVSPVLSTVTNELGIFGLYIGNTELNELENKECGLLMRTKMAGVEEGGIFSGYSGPDSVFIV